MSSSRQFSSVSKTSPSAIQTARFAHFDVYEGLYNPTGKFRLQELTIPAANNSIDVIILHSVFTHMMEDDIMHYLKEFARILKPTGKVLATFFVVDDEIRKSAQIRQYLSFNHKRSPDCYIEDLSIPTRAVGYTESALRSMVTRAGLKLSRPICFGFWSGHHPAPHYGGQDALIMQRDI